MGRRWLENKHRQLPQTFRELTGWAQSILSTDHTQEIKLNLIIDGFSSVRDNILQSAKSSEEMKLRDLENRLAIKYNKLQRRFTDTHSHYEEIIKKLADQLSKDSRTDLMNFDHFISEMEVFLANESRMNGCILGFIDCAEFKEINDGLGHAAGDEVLYLLARQLEFNLRPQDIISKERRATSRTKDLQARFGGDEFVFFIPGPTSIKTAQAIGDRLQASMEAYPWPQRVVDRLGHPVYADIGVVVYKMDPILVRRPKAALTARLLCSAADYCMYQAKDRAKVISKRGGKHAGQPVSRVYARSVEFGDMPDALVIKQGFGQRKQIETIIDTNYQRPAKR